jgi:hypothetical protein
MRFAPIVASLGGRPRQKPKPNLAKSSKIPPSPLKENQRKKLGFPWISLSELSPFNGLQRPLVAKNSFPAPFLAKAFGHRRASFGDRGKIPRILIFEKEKSTGIETARTLSTCSPERRVNEWKHPQGQARASFREPHERC